jgi:hypothetical protein
MSNMTLPDSFYVRYKKRPLDFDQFEYRLVRGWWREYHNIIEKIEDNGKRC